MAKEPLTPEQEDKHQKRKQARQEARQAKAQELESAKAAVAKLEAETEEAGMTEGQLAAKKAFDDAKVALQEARKAYRQSMKEDE